MPRDVTWKLVKALPCDIIANSPISYNCKILQLRVLNFVPIKYLLQLKDGQICDGMDSDFSMKWIGGIGMNVAGTPSTQTAYNAYDRQGLNSTGPSITTNAAKVDSVSISEEGRVAAEETQVVSKTKTTEQATVNNKRSPSIACKTTFSAVNEAVERIKDDGGNARALEVPGGDWVLELLDSEGNPLPLEAYAMPPWQRDYYPAAMAMDGNHLEEYFDFMHEALSDDYLSNEEHIRAREYMEPMRKADQFYKEFQNEIREYSEILHNYLSEALKKNEISPGEQYYNDIIQNKESSERVHQDFRANLLNDPRAVELMEQLGIAA